MARNQQPERRTPAAAHGSPLDPILAKVREFRQLGASSLEEFPKGKRYDTVKKEAKAKNFHPEMLRRARYFAKHYTEEEVEELIREARRLNYALGVHHVTKLMSVPKEGRQSFQKQAIKARWSVSRLSEEIQKGFGNRMEYAGPGWDVPEDPKEACFEIYVHCRRWSRFSGALRNKPSEESKPELRKDLPPKVRGAIRKADAVLAKLATLARVNSSAKKQKHSSKARQNRRARKSK